MIRREPWPPERRINHGRAREVRGEQPADAALVQLRDRGPLCCTSRGLAVPSGSGTRTYIALSKQSGVIRAPRRAIKTAAATGLALKLSDPKNVPRNCRSPYTLDLEKKMPCACTGLLGGGGGGGEAFRIIASESSLGLKL